MAQDPCVRVCDVSLGTLRQVPVEGILPPGQDRELVSASLKLLASTIRNRDAHRYAPDVRAGHFKAVPRLFVPAFNILLAALDQTELRRRVSGA